VQVRTPWRKKPVLVYPIPPAPPTAILVDGFRPSGNTRVFEKGWTEEAAQFGPAAIAGTPSQLDALRAASIPSLRNALIALVRPGEPPLTEDDRARLWRAFRVPVFEQRIDQSGRLLAAECEAHDGLHVESPDASPRSGEVLETEPCGCGRTTPRLIAPERVENMKKVAAYAR
jgi:phenylacetate-coenzyme A ligase PaaK-like adenylate-forming protein